MAKNPLWTISLSVSILRVHLALATMNSCIVYLIVKSPLLIYMALMGLELAEKKQRQS